MDKCQSCGAALPVVPPGSVLRCAFCGIEQRVGTAPRLQQWGPPPPQVGFPQGTPVKVSPLLYVLPFGLMLVGVGFSLLMSRRAQDQAEAASVEAVSQAGMAAGATGATPAKHVLELSDLSTARFQGWEPLNAPGMVGTLDAFDVIANIPWAVRVAQSWVSDARLDRVDFGRVEKSGQVNLRTIPDANSGYRFVSPSRSKEYLNSAALVDPKTITEFEIQVDKDGVKVIELSSKPMHDEVDPAVAPPACTLGQALAALDKAGKLPARPVYTGYLIASDAKRTLYFVNTLTGSPSIPIVNAATCKVE